MNNKLVLICLAGWLASGCHITSPSDNNTSTFNGTVLVGGTVIHQFSASKTGEYSIRLTRLTPDSSELLGVLLGQPQPGGCAQISFNVGKLNVDVLSGPIQHGDYCVSVYDAGYLVRPEDYTLVVSHP